MKIIQSSKLIYVSNNEMCAKHFQIETSDRNKFRMLGNVIFQICVATPHYNRNIAYLHSYKHSFI